MAPSGPATSGVLSTRPMPAGSRRGHLVDVTEKGEAEGDEARYDRVEVLAARHERGKLYGGFENDQCKQVRRTVEVENDGHTVVRAIPAGTRSAET
jgi:hypothetical protein